MSSVQVFQRYFAFTMIGVVFGLIRLNISLQLAFAVTLCSCVFAFIVLRGQRRELPIYCLPNFWVILSTFFIYIFSPMILFSQKIDLSRRFESMGWRDAMPEALLYGALIFLATVTGILSAKKSTTVNISRGLKPNLVRFLWVVLLSSALYLRWVSQQGGLQNILATRNAQVNLGITRNVGYFVDVPIFLCGAVIFLYCYLLVEKEMSLIREILFLITIVFLISPNIASGSRSVFLFIFLAFIIAKKSNSVLSTNLMGFKINRNKLLAVLILIPLLVVAPRLYRDSSTFNPNSVKEAYSQSQVLTTIAGDDMIMVPTFAILLKKVPNDIQYMYGKSYLTAALKPIPRILWKNKPIEFDTYLNQRIFPETARYFGVAFSGASEPFVNFGFFGIAFFFHFLSRFNGYFTRVLVFNRNNPFILFSFSLWTAFMFILIRGNLSTDYHRFLFPCFAAFFVSTLVNSKSNDEISKFEK